MSQISLAICLLSLALLPLSAAGLALIHQGLGRSRSAAHAMLATLCVLAVAAIVFVLVGASWAGYSGGAFHSFQLGGVSWNWVGNEPLLGQNLSHLDARSGLIFCLGMFAAGLAAIIPLSAGTDRWRLGSICLATAVFAGFTFPLFAHWVWGGGWLAQLAANFGIAPFVDMGGAGVFQVAGGLMALSVAWILGPRRGKYSGDGMATAIPGHNIVLVLFGCLIALVGWIGLDTAASILLYGLAPEQLASVMVNAMLSASAGCLAAVVTTQLRYRKPDASLSANGWIAGLVAGSAGCAMVAPLAAVFIGAAAGVIVTLMVDVLELRLLIDDPGGAISVHAGAGIWGLVAMGVFGRHETGTLASHILAQLVGAATLVGFLLPLIHGIHLLLNRLLPFRVDLEGKTKKKKNTEQGEGAYP